MDLSSDSRGSAYMHCVHVFINNHLQIIGDNIIKMQHVWVSV